MKSTFSQLISTASLSLLMATSSLWASDESFEDEKPLSSSPIQASSQTSLEREQKKVQLLAQRVNQYPTVSYNEQNSQERISIPKEIMFLIMDNMEPQVFGNFLAVSQSSFDIARDYLSIRKKSFIKRIASKEALEAYRKSCLLGTLPHVTLGYYDDRGLPEEIKTALRSFRAENYILFDKDINFLSLLTNLHSLDLSYQDLRERVTVLINLSGLYNLNVSNNYLGHYVTVVKSFTNLHTLDLSNNELSENVTILVNLPKLCNLNISLNKIGKDFSALRVLTNLYTLDLAENSLGEHVTEIMDFLKLTKLNIGGNEVSKHITAIIALSNLRDLDISRNSLSEYITVITSLTNLCRLKVKYNNLGQNSHVLTALTNLKLLKK